MYGTIYVQYIRVTNPVSLHDLISFGKSLSVVYVCSLQEIAKIVISAICTLISRTKYRGARS